MPESTPLEWPVLSSSRGRQVMVRFLGSALAVQEAFGALQLTCYQMNPFD